MLTAERAKYEKQVNKWNEQHPEETLVINKKGNAVLSQADPEKQKKKEEKAATKAAMYALNVNMKQPLCAFHGVSIAIGGHI